MEGTDLQKKLISQCNFPSEGMLLVLIQIINSNNF